MNMLGRHGTRWRYYGIVSLIMSVTLIGSIIATIDGFPDVLAMVPAAYVANTLLKHFYLEGMGIKAPLKQLFRWWEIP